MEQSDQVIYQNIFHQRYIIDAICKATKAKPGCEVYAERFGREAEALFTDVFACPQKDWV